MKKNSRHKQDASTWPEILWPEMDLTFADFFCGAGGFSLGLINAGLKCISAMDIAPDALWTYWYNLCYKGWSHFYADPENPEIKRMKKSNMWNNGETSNAFFPNGIPDNWLSPAIKEPMPCLNLFMYSIMDIEPEEWMQMCKVRPGDIRIFVGGPPCQGFSTSNSQRSILDARNQLPIRFIYYCKICKPEIVLIENVPGILTLGKKKGEKEGPFPIWLREKFEDAGYHMEYKTLNAADYGVPQNRKRVFFFAVRNDKNYTNLFPKPTHGKNPQWRKSATCASPPLEQDCVLHITTLEAIGHQPPLHAGEQWGKDVFHPYGYNQIPGYVICHNCLQYNQQSRTECHNCKKNLTTPIKGGVLRLPGCVLFDTQNHIDNEELRNFVKTNKNRQLWN